MKEESIIYVAGNAYKESECAAFESIRCKTAFFDGFKAGVKFYANHLFKEMNLREIMISIRQTADVDRYSYLLDCDKVILAALKFHSEHYSDMEDLRKEYNTKINELESSVANERRKNVELKKSCKELNEYIESLKRQG